MPDCSFLLDLIEKLILHIRNSKANQEAIFNTFTVHDFKKMLQYMENQDKLTRISSLNLLSELLVGNPKLKRKYCQLMSIALLPGKIILNPKTFLKNINPLTVTEIISMLKNQTNSVQNNCLLWYINISPKHEKSQQNQIKYIYKDSDSECTKIQNLIDPEHCIVGFCLSKYTMLNFHMPQFLFSKQLKTVNQSPESQSRNSIQSNPQIEFSPGQSRNQFMRKYFNSRLSKDNFIIPITHRQSQLKKKFSKDFKQSNFLTSIQTQRLKTQNSHTVIQKVHSKSRTSKQKIDEVSWMPILNFQSFSKKKLTFINSKQDYISSTKDISVEEVPFIKVKVKKNFEEIKTGREKNFSYFQNKSIYFKKKGSGQTKDSSNKVQIWSPTQRRQEKGKTFRAYHRRTQSEVYQRRNLQLDQPSTHQ